jgi:hypothetical protein
LGAGKTSEFGPEPTSHDVRWGSVTYWNAYVANVEMHGKGTFFDPRLNDQARFSIAATANLGDVHHEVDRVTPKLAALLGPSRFVFFLSYSSSLRMRFRPASSVTVCSSFS